LEITIPHNLKLERTKDKYVIDYLGTPKRFSILVWHRRAKKSRSALNRQIMRIMARKEPGVCYYVLPTYRQAKQVVWDALINDHVPPQIYDKKNDSELAIYYKNGVIQRFIGSEDPDKHRGTNPFDVVFDEYAEQTAEIWEAIFQPVLMENNGTASFVFTPKGKNHAWKLLQMAKDNPLWFVSERGVKDTEVFGKTELDEIKRNTPSALYAQEYEIAFNEAAGAFFRRVRQNLYDRNATQPEYGDFQLGVDLAKYQDFTVLTPFNMNTFRVYPQDRFNQIDWNLQKARIEATALRYKARVKIDATGVGDPIVEDLKSRGLNINDDDAIKFTESSRMNLLNHLAMLIEQDKIELPNDEGLLMELEAFQYSLTPLGKVKVGVPEGIHDDRVISLALAVWGCSNMIPIDMYLHNPRFANRELEGNLYSATYD
jgi:hypothetical protein